MVIELHKRDSIKKLNQWLERARQNQKSLDLDKFFGKVKFKEDGLTIQKKLRNDW